jgi:GTPase
MGLPESESGTLLPEETPAGHRSGFVAVIGRPNVGKSTLINRMVGQKVAIVSPKPQTTRDRLLGILTRDDAQVIFVDTPGIHMPLHRPGEIMVDVAADTLRDADVVLWVVDVAGRPTEEDRRVGRMLEQALSRRPQAAETDQTGHEAAGAPAWTSRVLLALNKEDLLKPEHVQENVDTYAGLAPGAPWMLVSATRGDNVDRLLGMLIELLPDGPRYYPPDQVTDQQERFMVGELVREQVLLQLRQEVPHSIAVNVDEFKEKDGSAYISAVI